MVPRLQCNCFRFKSKNGYFEIIVDTQRLTTKDIGQFIINIDIKTKSGIKKFTTLKNELVFNVKDEDNEVGVEEIGDDQDEDKEVGVEEIGDDQGS